MGNNKLKKRNKNYFGKKQEQAIKDYLSNEKLTKVEKEKLYIDIIHPAFEKLVENIVYTYGNKFQFFNMGYEPEDLISMGVTYCYQKLPRFDVKLNKKAYSFFGTIVKRYFIQVSIKTQKNKKTHINLNSDNTTNSLNSKTGNIRLNDINLMHIEDHDDNDKIFDSNFINEMKIWFLENKEQINIITDDDIKIMKAILDLIDFSKTLENINKKALYIYIKEMTGIDKSYKIANVIKKMKEPFFIFRENYISSYGKILSGSLKHKK